MQKKLAIFAIVLVFILGGLLGAWLRGLKPGPVPEPDIQRDTVWLRDTVKLPAPKPQTVHVTDTTYIPVRDTIRLKDTTYVAVPISQTYYHEKEYQAWVSGYRAKLDSIHVIQSTAVVEVPVYKTVTKTKHWSVTVGPQVGYGFTPKGWQPYAGVGITAGYTF